MKMSSFAGGSVFPPNREIQSNRLPSDPPPPYLTQSTFSLATVHEICLEISSLSWLLKTANVFECVYSAARHLSMIPGPKLSIHHSTSHAETVRASLSSVIYIIYDEQYIRILLPGCVSCTNEKN